MWVAVDDTDSREGMCTTFLLTEIIDRSGLEVIGLPRLVRLNPAIRYKTRGNGALAVNLGHGSGESRIIGEIRGKQLRSYSRMKGDANGSALVSLTKEIIDELAVLEDPNTNPGAVFSGKSFPEEFYWKAVREEVSISDAESFIVKNGGKLLKFKNGRGIIGAAASLSWPAKERTFEMLTYRDSTGKNPGHETRMKVAEQADQIPGTFNNIDVSNRYAAVFPKERTPVVLGVRGAKDKPLLEGLPPILLGNSVNYDRYVCYETNQATDDHITPALEGLSERRSYFLEGFVNSKPEAITGGHYFSQLETGDRLVKIAAFEPTKEFREIFRLLIPGDLIRVFGSYVGKALNIEKMEILGLSRHFSRESPMCSNCGSKMKSKGIDDYRCPACHKRQKLAHYRRFDRNLAPGKYDVPIIARRHISRPFELDGITLAGNSMEEE